VFDDDAKMRTISAPDLLFQCTQVYQGEFPHASDKTKLVSTVLNLWAKTLYKVNEDETVEGLYDYVLKHAKDIFPLDLFSDVPSKLASALVK
jgi:hypothetical protein